MELPQITQDEFDELNEGPFMPRPFLLQAHDPEEIYTAVEGEPKTAGLRVYFLPVSVPHFYMQPNGKPALVLPVKGVDYNDLSAVYPEHDAWAYTIAQSYEDEMAEVNYFFRDGTDVLDGKKRIPAFNLDDLETH